MSALSSCNCEQTGGRSTLMNEHDFEPTETTDQEKVLEISDLTTDEISVVDALVDSESVRNKLFQDKETQVNSGEMAWSFISTIETDEQLNSLTGILNFKMLNSFEELLSKVHPDQKKDDLSVKERIVLVFLKLRLSVKFKILSFLFRISQTTVKSIFSEYTSCLAAIFKCCVYWPSSDEISRNMPKCFETFQNVRVIADCIEIPLEKLSCLSCRIATYSYIKGMQTIKFMVGTSPAGLITFISECYGGRNSKEDIFEEIKLIDKLEPSKDSVMVGKGFLIEDICKESNIQLISPVIPKDERELSEQEANLNFRISKARLHIEKVHQNMMNFEILKGPLPLVLLKHINDIVLIIGAMVNLQPPVLHDREFMKV